MSAQPYRLPAGGRIDRSRCVNFSFDGRVFTGHPGDTLASALIAHGVHFTGRSFKYHRPRGIYTCGPEEPNALVSLKQQGCNEPNIPATQIEIFDGLVSRSQNCWPSLSFDILSINSLLKPFLPVGFYYKTFMWPRSFWLRLYEPLIRRAAGLGKLSNIPDSDRYEHANAWCDVLIVGAGPAGLMAARAAARANARIILVDERPYAGGHLAGETLKIDGQPAMDWVHNIWQELAAMKNVRLLTRTSVFGQYDGLTFGAIERVGDHSGAGAGNLPRQRRWKIFTQSFVCATGAIERPLVFEGNDRPGVMLANAARSYVNQFGALPGRNAVVFTNNDDAYRTARDLRAAGAKVTIVDSRPESQVTGNVLLDAETEVYFGHCLVDVQGRKRVRSVSVASLKSTAKSARKRLPCDLVCVSGGWNPTIHLMSHCGARPAWDDKISSFVMKSSGAQVHAVGGAAGTFDLQELLREGDLAGRAATKAYGSKGIDTSTIPTAEALPAYGVEPLWRIPASLSASSTSFVDLQSDATLADIEIAKAEGFGHAEHTKRYTTIGMATDQGKLANVNTLGILSELQGCSIPEIGTTTFRPMYSAASLGALAGQSTGRHYRPVRRSAMHDWHEQHSTVFTDAGLWKRPHYYLRPGEDFAKAVEREVRTVRSNVGMVDVSTLGKIEVKGEDAGAFLDFLYINSFSKLKAGGARYGLMLREDGFAFDDGVVMRLAPDHYFLTTTTAHAASVMGHMEFCQQVHWPELDVQFCSVTEAWAVVAVAGPKSRKLLERIVKGIDLSNMAFPELSVASGSINDAFVRVSRTSFSGELAYEIYTPTGSGLAVWESIMNTGRAFEITAYGTEAMTVMRVEKGHVAGPELDGCTTADDLGFGAMMSRKKEYIGRWPAKRSGLEGEGRQQIVGVRPIHQGDSFEMGAHLVNDPCATGPEVSQGHVTTAVFSPTCNHFIGLALLKNGRTRMGERLHAVSPVHGTQTEVQVVDPVFVDPAKERMRA